MGKLARSAQFGLLAAISTCGAGWSSTGTRGFGVGSRRFSGIGVSRYATGTGALNSRTGAGSWFTGGGVVTRVMSRKSLAGGVMRSNPLDAEFRHLLDVGHGGEF